MVNCGLKKVNDENAKLQDDFECGADIRNYSLCISGLGNQPVL